MKKRLITILVMLIFVLSQIQITYANQDAIQFGDRITYQGIEYVVDDTNQKLYRINENGKFENVLEDCFVLGIYIMDDNLYASILNNVGEPGIVFIAGVPSLENPFQLMAVSNEQAIFNYLTGTMGINTAAACGVLANIQAESSFNPTALGDNGTSYGICQWHNTRWDNLKNYCNSRGYNWQTLDGQLRFLQYELENSYKSTNSTLRSVPNTKQGAYDAAYYWCYYFEVPANRAQKSVQRGNTAANTYWAKYGTVTTDITKASINDSSVFIKQATGYTCTLASAVMMLRRRAIIDNNANWESITESAVRPIGWLEGSGLYWNFTYAGMKVGHGTFSGNRQTKLLELLASHPEGVVAYATNAQTHAILITDYTNGEFYCADPAKGGGRIKLSASTIKSYNGSQMNNFTAYWYITNKSGGGTGVTVTKPSAPSNAYLSPADCAVGATVSASWAGVSGADKYAVTLTCTTNSAYSQSEKEVSGSSTAYVLNNPGTYRISVKAHNSAGWSDESAQSATVTVHPNNDVTFKDWDGTVLKNQSVSWGANATAPVAPSRKHYTFQGWDNGFTNIKAPLTVNATYKINKYTVKFYGYNGILLSSQSVEALTSATTPDPKPPEGFVFVDWDSHGYESVETDLEIKAAYEWGNPDLPNILEITSAVRNQARDGYDVEVKLTNYPLGATRGRVVVTLKTEAGKMVAVVSETYRIDELTKESRSFYVPYSGVATNAEASVLGIYDEDKTGVPLAKIAHKTVDLGTAWSDWSINQPPKGDLTTESRTEYRYKDKQTTTNSSSTLSGWTLTGSAASGWGSWSGWSTSPVSATATREVETRDVPNGYNMTYYATQTAASPYYRYYRNYSINGNYTAYGTRSSYGEHHKSAWWSLGSWNGAGTYGAGTWSSGTYAGKNASSVTGYTIAWDGYIWFTNGSTYEKQYRYRDATYTYSFEKWGDWSDWEAGTVPAATASKQVETRTTYRFKNNSIKLTAYNYKRYVYTNLNTGNKVYTYNSAYADSLEFPGEWEYDKSYSEKPVYTTEDGIKIYGTGYGENSWYAADVNSLGNVTEYETSDTLEDTNGEKRHISGSVNARGKAATLLVFRQTNQDPLQSQLEYVDQTILGADGEYSFDFITKEEPTDKTGDFIIMLAVEGGTTPVYISKIDAPKPLYTVVFAGDDGTELSRQTVKEGDSATVPQNPVKEGYEFIGWDENLTNINRDMTVAAQYRKQKFNVVFVDWNNEEIQIKEYEYGDILHLDEISDKEGSSFAGFVDSEGKDVVTVTRNMVVSAKYELNTYTIKFLDWDGNTVDEQFVEYGGTADFEAVPDVGDPDGFKLFATWGNMLEALCVEGDVILYPIAKYAQTVADPVISLESGEYKGEQKVIITCSTPGAKIIFTTDGTMPDYETNSKNTYSYYGAISVSKETQINAMAYIDEMNDSSVVYAYYTITVPEYGSFAAELTDITGGGTANYTITNNSGSAYTPAIILAIYNKDGALVYYKKKDDEVLTVGENKGSFTMPALTETGYTAKLFIWDSSYSAQPLAKTAEKSF